MESGKVPISRNKQGFGTDKEDDSRGNLDVQGSEPATDAPTCRSHSVAVPIHNNQRVVRLFR